MVTSGVWRGGATSQTRMWGTEGTLQAEEVAHSQQEGVLEVSAGASWRRTRCTWWEWDTRVCRTTVGKNLGAPLSGEGEERRQKASTQVSGSLGNGSSKPWVRDCWRWDPVAVGHWSLNKPVRHPAKMSVLRAVGWVWGSGETGLKEWISASTEKAATEMQESAREEWRLGWRGYKSPLATLNHVVHGLLPHPFWSWHQAPASRSSWLKPHPLRHS